MERDEYKAVAERLGLPATSVKGAAELLDEGATVPFIARYRKERTGSLDEVQIRAVEATLKLVRELEARRSFVREAIEGAGGMTPELSRRLDGAASMTEVISTSPTSRRSAHGRLWPARRGWSPWRR